MSESIFDVNIIEEVVALSVCCYRPVTPHLWFDRIIKHEAGTAPMMQCSLTPVLFVFADLQQTEPPSDLLPDPPSKIPKPKTEELSEEDSKKIKRYQK